MIDTKYSHFRIDIDFCSAQSAVRYNSKLVEVKTGGDISIQVHHILLKAYALLYEHILGRFSPRLLWGLTSVLLSW